MKSLRFNKLHIEFEMASNGLLNGTMKKEPFALATWRNRFLNECEKLQKINEIFGHSLNVEDFVKKLNLCNFGIDPHHDIDLDVVSIEQVIEVLGSKNANDFNVKVNDHLTKKCNAKEGYLSSVNARLILGLGQIEWAVLFFGVHHYYMECMVAFSLALCALGTWEVAVDNDE